MPRCATTSSSRSSSTSTASSSCTTSGRRANGRTGRTSRSRSSARRGFAPRRRPGIADIVLDDGRPISRPSWCGSTTPSRVSGAGAPGAGFAYIGPNGRPVSAPTRARSHPGARDPAGVDRRVDLPRRRRPPPGDRPRRRGRKQYRYHPHFRAHRDAGEVRAPLRVRHGAAGDPQAGRDRSRRAAACHARRSLAAVVRLLEATLVRVGNEEYARANKSYGLTTLRDRHAQFTSDGLRLVFKGKHGHRRERARAGPRGCDAS